MLTNKKPDVDLGTVYVSIRSKDGKDHIGRTFYNTTPKEVAKVLDQNTESQSAAIET